MCSSRVRANLECLDRHPEEPVIIFSCFTTYLEIVAYYLGSSRRPVFKMTSEMSSTRRGTLIEEFKKSKNGVLLLTYQLGATGLNLQFAATVMLVDFWWNAGVTQQAIGRIYRLGQNAPTVNVYFFTANTGIEKILFEKQGAKLALLEELRTGACTTTIPKVRMDEIVRMIELSDNVKQFQTIRYY